MSSVLNIHNTDLTIDASDNTESKSLRRVQNCWRYW